MTPLPDPLLGWRLDMACFASGWASGEGAFRVGGRWNSRGVRAVYCSVDPATAILEVAVHKGFRALDTVPHILTALAIRDPAAIRVVQPRDLPDPAWLAPGIPGPAQQAFGDSLLARHGLVLIPSVVSRFSWNLVFDPAIAATRTALHRQAAFVLDPRLHPPGP